jgi:hypothetical protein
MITTKQIVEKVRDLAKRYKANKYHSYQGVALYTHGFNSECPEPGCIVGVALQECGIETELLAEIDNEALTDYSVSIGISRVLGQLEDRVSIDSPKDITFLANVQTEQDLGSTWSQAVKYVDACLGNQKCLS